jgi:hypothetical protein
MVGSTADVSSTSKPPREVLNGIVASAGFEQRVRSLAADSGRLSMRCEPRPWRVSRR